MIFLLILAHRNKVHPPRSNFKCKNCSAVFETYGQLNEHRRTEHSVYRKGTTSESWAAKHEQQEDSNTGSQNMVVVEDNDAVVTEDTDESMFTVIVQPDNGVDQESPENQEVIIVPMDGIEVVEDMAAADGENMVTSEQEYIINVPENQQEQSEVGQH